MVNVKNTSLLGHWSKNLILLVTICLLVACAAPADKEDDPGESGEGVSATASPAAESTEDVAPDLNGQIFRVVQIGNMTGKGSEFVLPMVRGVEDYFAYLNESGGVYGAELGLTSLDSQGSGEIVENLILSWGISEHPHLLLLLDSEIAHELQGVLAELQIPTITPYLRHNAQRDDSVYVFGILPPPEVELIFLMEYLLENWEEVRPDTEAEEIKLGVLAWPNFFGHSALTATARDNLEEMGIPIVFEGVINATYTEDSQPALRAAERAEVNVLFVQGYAYGPAVVLDDLYWLGLQDRMLVAGPGAALDTNLYGYLARPEYFDGFYAATGLQWWSEEDHVGIVLAESLLAENDRTLADRSQGRLIGHALADYVLEVFAESARRSNAEQSISELLLPVLSEEFQITLVDGLLTISGSSQPQNPAFLRVWRVEGPGIFTPLTELVEFSYPPK